MSVPEIKFRLQEFQAIARWLDIETIPAFGFLL